MWIYIFVCKTNIYDCIFKHLHTFDWLQFSFLIASKHMFSSYASSRVLVVIKKMAQSTFVNMKDFPYWFFTCIVFSGYNVLEHY